MYHAIEEYLSSVCHDRPLPTDEESADAVQTDLLPHYSTNKGATLTMGNSIDKLNKYSSSYSPASGLLLINSEQNEIYCLSNARAIIKRGSFIVYASSVRVIMQGMSLTLYYRSNARAIIKKSLFYRVFCARPNARH